jgi:hypothetical protein
VAQVSIQHNSTPTYLKRHLSVAELRRAFAEFSTDFPIAGKPFFATLKIKLPLYENPVRGKRKRKPQPQYKFDRTEREMRLEFEGYDFHDTGFRGHCKNEKGKWEDDLNVLIEVDAEFDDARIRRLKIMKRRFKRRFKQWEIYMCLTPVKRL